MKLYAYSPDTGELINIETPADWMKTTDIQPPAFNAYTSGCFFRNGAWEIVQGDQITPAIERQIGILTAAYYAAMQAPVEYMGTTFQASVGSQSQITNSIAAGSVPAGFYWLDANNVQVLMTFAQLQGLAAAILAQGQSAFAHLQAQKAAVRAAQSVVAIQSIVW